jgi:predicted transcriptional regulator
MPRSKLEKYLNIIEILHAQPLELQKLADNTDLDSKELRKHLGFLTLHGLVKKQKLGKKTVYVMTDIGLAVLRTMKVQKHFEKIRNIIYARSMLMTTSSNPRIP